MAGKPAGEAKDAVEDQKGGGRVFASDKANKPEQRQAQLSLLEGLRESPSRETQGEI